MIKLYDKMTDIKRMFVYTFLFIALNFNHFFIINYQDMDENKFDCYILTAEAKLLHRAPEFKVYQNNYY